jgi:hypothetical protein
MVFVRTTCQEIIFRCNAKKLSVANKISKVFKRNSEKIWIPLEILKKYSFDKSRLEQN